MVGGMPAVVVDDVRSGDVLACRRHQRDIIATYRDDFAKYSGRSDPRLLDGVLRACVGSLGRKFIYSRVGEGVKQHQAKRALELLAQARLCHLVHHSDANGVPLGGEVKERFRKVILLDVGLVHALLGTRAGGGLPEFEKFAPQVRGQLAEQMMGQQLRTVEDPSEEPVFVLLAAGGWARWGN